jgi:hypothetical protein
MLRPLLRLVFTMGIKYSQLDEFLRQLLLWKKKWRGPAQCQPALGNHGLEPQGGFPAYARQSE